MKNIVCSGLLCAVLMLCCSASGQKISTFAGNGTVGYTDSGGVPKLAAFNHPWGIVMDKGGNIFIADHVNSAIRKISTAGVISTFAGTTTEGHSGDSGAATAAMLMRPAGLALDAAGNLYIADKADNRIRKVDTAGIITTFAGKGTAGYTGDGGPDTSATLNTPTGVAFDAAGNLYIADSGNNVIRKINTSGIISTFAGTGAGSYTGDGGIATAATLSGPVGVAVDATGNVFIADNLNNVVRKVNTSLVISTFAGNGTAGYSGNGGPATAAQFYTPNSIAFDGEGNVYITDQENAVLREVTASGTIVTIAGNGTPGYSGDGGQAQDAQMYKPMGVIIDSIGDIYICDFINSVVRLINVQRAAVHSQNMSAGHLSVYPVPATDHLKVTTDAQGSMLLTIDDITGRCMYRTELDSGNKGSIDISSFPRGCYVASGYCNGVLVSSVRFIKN